MQIGRGEWPDLLTRAEAAKLLRISAATLARWAEAGRIPQVKMVGTVRYDRQDIEEFLRAAVRNNKPAVATAKA